MTESFTPTVVERPTLARILGCSVRTIASMEAEKVFQPATRGKGRRPSTYALEHVVPAYIAHRERQVSGQEASPRDRRDLSVATLNELRIARERGDVVERDAVVLAGRSVVETARTRLLRLPADLRRADVVSRDGESLAERIVREALDELARLESVV